MIEKMNITLVLCAFCCCCLLVEPAPVLERAKRSHWDKAMEYYKKLHTEHSCSSPQPRVIPVQDIHPNSRLMYVTTCVVLERCAHDTGCCPETDVCVPKEVETVEIPIITTNAKSPYELLTFTNHLSCHCLPKKHADANGV